MTRSVLIRAIWQNGTMKMQVASAGYLNPSSHCGWWISSSPHTYSRLIIKFNLWKRQVVTVRSPGDHTDEISDGFKLPTEETVTHETKQNRKQKKKKQKQQVWATLETSSDTNTSLFQKDFFKPLWRKTWESCLSCVAMLVAGRCWDHVVLCSYVPRGRSRFTYCIVYKQRGEDICCSSSTTLHSIHFIHYSYPDPLLEGETTLHLRSDSWFYQAERPSGGRGVRCLVGFRPFCSFWEKST